MALDLKYGQVTLEHSTIGEDEPVIVFRAQDRLVPDLLKIYKILCGLAGSPEHHLQAIHETAMTIKAWQLSNREQVKTPTSDSLAPPHV